MDIYQTICSTLTTSLKDADLADRSSCGEQQLRPALLSFLDALKPIASEVCKDFNPFGLLCALQHYIPTTIALPQEGFEPDAQIDFNNAAALAFRFSSETAQAKVKFTPADYREAGKKQDFSWLDSYTEVIQQIYHVVRAIDIAVKNLRMLGKGASAIINLSSDDFNRIVLIQPSPGLQRKVSDWDERLLKNQSFLIHYGLPVGVPKSESPLKGVVVNLNWSGYREGNTDPPPVAKVFDMEGIYAATTLHATEVTRIFDTRVYVEDLFAFLATLFKPLVEDVHQKKRFAGSGYTFVQEQDLIDYIVSLAPKVYVDCFNQVFKDYREGVIILESFMPKYWEEVVPRLLNFISHDFASRESINCQLFRPIRFVYRCDDGTVFLHLGSVIHFLAHLWDGFQPMGDFTFIKGHIFEKLVLRALESVNDFTRIWDTSYKLNFPVEGKARTDVDIFVRRKQLAFLISCKSYSTNRKYWLGDGQSAWDRSEMAKSWLHSAQRVAKAVVDHRKELNLNPEIKGIVPLVCTGWPEYLIEPSNDYFWEDGTPRIATPQEIEQFFKTIDDGKAEKLLCDPWIVHVPQPPA